jgi:hypothetical protein
MKTATLFVFAMSFDNRSRAVGRLAVLKSAAWLINLLEQIVGTL